MAKSGAIRLGIVGLGRAGMSMHEAELKSRKRTFRIAAVCDVLPGRRQEMAQRHKCRYYARIEDLIADPAVEMVDIATRSCDHFAHARMALKAGKDVFLEKPICLTHAEAKQLRSLSARSKGTLYVRHNRRFEPAFHHIREIIASGVLGEVYEIKLRRGSFQQRNDWQTLKRFGGGQLLNWGPHIIDHGLRLLESPLRGIWGDLKQVAAAGNAEDHLKILLTGANGRVIDLEISGGAVMREPTYLVSGSRGGLTSDGTTIHLKHLAPRKKLPAVKADPGTPRPGFSFSPALKWIDKTIPVRPKKKVDMSMIWDELYKAVRKGATFPISLDEAVEVMKVVSAVKKGTRFDTPRRSRRR